MEPNNSLLQFFEISDVMKALKNIILEFLFIAFLLFKLLSQILNLVGQTFLSHSKIINDQSQILVNSVEVLQLLSHLICLLVKFLDFKLSWANISLKLLDFVIKHEFELF